MVPALVTVAGAPWMVLPPGIHPATLAEIQAAYATNAQRRDLFDGLVYAAQLLFHAGCATLYLNGSYVTEKPVPNDYDACWDLAGVDPTKLDPTFRDFSNGRKAQKTKFKGEFFPSTVMNQPGQTFLQFFQIERFTGQPKGILSIFLRAEATLTRRAHP
jgi:hypothetical protein